MSHVVSYGKNRLLAGLYWSRLQSPHKKRKIIREELDDLASEYQTVHEAEPDIGAMHSTGLDLLLGVGERPTSTREIGKKEKVKSLVCLALMANPETRSFVGRLCLEEGVEWIAVVRSGIVSPVGDLVVGRDEANEAFDTLCSRNNDLPVLFNETSQDPSDKLVRDWLQAVRLRKVGQVKELRNLGSPPLSTRMVLVYGIISTVLISGLYIGYAQYQGYVERKEAEAAAARRAAMAELNQLGPIPTPWKDWAEVSRVAEACLTHYIDRDDYRLGWQAVSWHCDGEQVTQEWRRTEIGSYSHLPVDEGFNISSPNEITHTEELNVALDPRGDEAISPKNEVAKILMDAARIHGMAIRLDWGSEETRTYMKGEEQKVERLGYSLNTATFTGKELSSLAVVQTLRKIPGLHIKSLTEEGSDYEIYVEFYTAV